MYISYINQYIYMYTNSCTHVHTHNHTYTHSHTQHTRPAYLPLGLAPGKSIFPTKNSQNSRPPLKLHDATTITFAFENFERETPGDHSQRLPSKFRKNQLATKCTIYNKYRADFREILPGDTRWSPSAMHPLEREGDVTRPLEREGDVTHPLEREWDVTHPLGREGEGHQSQQSFQKIGEGCCTIYILTTINLLHSITVELTSEEWDVTHPLGEKKTWT